MDKINELKKYVIVTGGLGYIGSHTVVELNAAGFIPVIIDNLSNSSLKNLDGLIKITKENINFHKIDCTNFNAVSNIFSNYKNIFSVIHFAAYKSVFESINYPDKYYKNNIESLNVILKVCEKFNINNLIFSSSCTVYGNPDILPVSENALFKKPESPYGHTKQLCEEIISKNKINSVNLRYFNPIGAHPSSSIGDFSHGNPTNLVPIITNAAKDKSSHLIINGNDYNTIDGTCVRDYIHVVDLSIAHVSALKFLLNNNGKYSFNVGLGKGYSVLEIIKFFIDITKIDLKYKFGPRRKGDVSSIYANTKLISNYLNWKPRYSIKEAILDAWNWELNK